MISTLIQNCVSVFINNLSDFPCFPVTYFNQLLVCIVMKTLTADAIEY